MNFKFIKTYETFNSAVYPLGFILPVTTNLWIFDSWTYLPEDGSTTHLRSKPPEKDLIVNVEDEMLYITREVWDWVVVKDKNLILNTFNETNITDCLFKQLIQLSKEICLFYAYIHYF